MSFKLKITINVIKRRISQGEALDTILLTYPKLSVEEIAIIREAIK
ncbi:MAG: hypothetical protein RSD64_04425 [Christensenellaceae bacterium]